jgi:hypothetical protein
MGWISKVFGSAESAPDQPATPPVWGKGRSNPKSPTVGASSGNITFPCPTCTRQVAVPVSKIDDRRGTLWGCRSCHDHFYLCGRDPDNNQHKGQFVTAGVFVPIANWQEWYTGHPVYLSLGETSWMLNEHGLWGFCASCERQLLTTVLCAFVNYQLFLPMKAAGARGYVFGATSAESAREMEALQGGACQNCGAKELVAIMTEIPQHIRQGIRGSR